MKNLIFMRSWSIMKIVIAGAGKVGFELARSLSGEHHVTVIDQNVEALERLQELIDQGGHGLLHDARSSGVLYGCDAFL